MKGVEDALGRLEGVQKIAIDLQSNLVTVTPRPGVEFALTDIPEAIRRAGFQPERMRIRAKGTADEGPPRTFRIAGWGRALPLTGGRVPPGESQIRASVEIAGESVSLEIEP